MKRLIGILAVTLGIAGTAFAGSAMAKEELLGAGATFPYPLYSKMFNAYYKMNGVKINYQAIGSGGGIRQIKNKTVDFGASDAFLSDEEMKKFSVPVVHIPICSGAVVVTYNLPGNPHIRLTPEVISAIFLGRIRKWGDPRITEINPGVNLPDLNIIAVHRSDGSGTTFIFSNYLSKISSEWAKEAGRGKSLNWPAGIGAKGNPGVAGLVGQLSGAIGYVELVYAFQSKMPSAEIRNKAGNFIKPSLETISLAADTTLPADMRADLTDTPADYGYPISGFTWMIVYKNAEDGGVSRGKARSLAKLLWWMTHQGQKYCKALHYAPLSEKARANAEKIIESIQYQGSPLFNENRQNLQ